MRKFLHDCFCIKRNRNLYRLTALFISFTVLSLSCLAAEDGNLLVNPGAESNYTGWSVSNGGSGWSTTFSTAHSGSRCWSSSYDPCTLTQTIDLVANGYDTAFLNTAPMISAGAYVITNYFSSGHVSIRVDLLDSANAIIRTNYAVNQNMNHKQWLLKYTSVSGYGKGLRKIRLTLRGEGDLFWADQYGPSFDDAFVYIISKTKAMSDDASGIFPRGATLKGIVYPGDKSTQVFFEYGTTESFGNTVYASESPVSGTSPVNIAVPVVLHPAKTYYTRMVSFNSSDTSYGVTKTFNTPDIILNPSVTSLTVLDSIGSKVSLNITSSVLWKAETDVNWISVSPDSAYGNNTVSVTVTGLNPTGEARYGKITFSGDTLQNIIVNVMQLRSTIHIIPNSFNIDSDADTFSVKVRTPYKWAPATNQSWIKVSPDSVTGSSYLDFIVTENAGSENRTGIIKLSNGIASDSIIINQSKGIITLTPSSINVIAEGDTVEIQVVTNFTWAASSSVPWISVSPDSVHGNGRVEIIVEENKPGLARTGLVTISNCRISASFTVNQKPLKGKGTEAEPYLIGNYNNLKHVKDYLDAHFQLTNDIDASASRTENGSSGFAPIGGQTGYFTGKFDGNGYVISSLYIGNGNYGGLFSRIRYATIKNLGLVNCNIYGRIYSGGFAGYVYNSTIQNCFVSGNVSSDWLSGGIAGIMYSATISNCYSTGAINCKYSNAAGITGSNDNTSIHNCYSTANISAREYAGGISSECRSDIRNSYMSGTLSGMYKGAIFALNTSGSVTNCYHNMEVTLQDSATGGIPLDNREMMRDTNFESWDFDSVWMIRYDSTYPGLRSLNNAPFAMNDTISAIRSARLSLLLANDYDLETLQSRLTYKVTTLSGAGSVNDCLYLFSEGATEGSITSITYRAGEILESGDTLWGNTAKAVFIKLPNDPPVGKSDSVSILKDNTAVIPAGFVLANDTDSNGDNLYVDNVIQGSHGNVGFSNDTIRYAHNPGWYGIDSIYYILSDGIDSDTCLIKVTVVATPEISWSDPADIIYGNPLDENQLNASAQIPGSFMYNPASGTVLNAGDAQIIAVIFTPDDTVLYTKATRTVTINVHKADITVTADDKTMMQGEMVPELTMQYTGFVNGDSIDDIDELPEITTMASASDIPGEYDILLTGGSDNNYNFILVNGKLEITLNTGIKSFTDEISVFPNPFADKLFVHNVGSMEIGFTIYSLAGSVILNGIITESCLDLSRLSPGIYMLKLTCNKETKLIQIIKQ